MIIVTLDVAGEYVNYLQKRKELLSDSSFPNPNIIL